MATRSTFFQKPTIELDQDKYEQLIKTETKYNQLFETIYNSFDESDELMDLLQVIDIEKYNQLDKDESQIVIVDELIEEPIEEIKEDEESDNVTNGEGESIEAEYKFKKGDRVKVISVSDYDIERGIKVGMTGELLEDDPISWVSLDELGDKALALTQLELIEREEK